MRASAASPAFQRISTPEIAAFDPAQLAQRLHERRHVGLRQRFGGGAVHQHADAPRRAGLRARGERPGGHRAADERDEFAAPCMSGKQHSEG
jgi:hypothetical protein